jgi:hypothetical protein
MKANLTWFSQNRSAALKIVGRPPDPLFAGKIKFIQTQQADGGVGSRPGGSPTIFDAD